MKHFQGSFEFSTMYTVLYFSLTKNKFKATSFKTLESARILARALKTLNDRVQSGSIKLVHPDNEVIEEF